VENNRTAASVCTREEEEEGKEGSSQLGMRMQNLLGDGGKRQERGAEQRKPGEATQLLAGSSQLNEDGTKKKLFKNPQNIKMAP